MKLIVLCAVISTVLLNDVMAQETGVYADENIVIQVPMAECLSCNGMNCASPKTQKCAPDDYICAKVYYATTPPPGIPRLVHAGCATISKCEKLMKKYKGYKIFCN